MKRTIATNNFVDELQPRLVFSPAVFWWFVKTQTKAKAAKNKKAFVVF